MPDIIDLHQYQERKSRVRTQSALELLYMHLIVRLHEQADLPDGSGTLETFLADLVADHLMGGMPPENLQLDAELEKLSERYGDFETRLRHTLYRRIAEARNF